jgi:hypothetical protein
MNSIDKKERQAETKINRRYTKGGKGDDNRTSQRDYAGGELWCVHGFMRDKCKRCEVC